MRNLKYFLLLMSLIIVFYIPWFQTSITMYSLNKIDLNGKIGNEYVGHIVDQVNQEWLNGYEVDQVTIHAKYSVMDYMLNSFSTGYSKIVSSNQYSENIYINRYYIGSLTTDKHIK